MKRPDSEPAKPTPKPSLYPTRVLLADDHHIVRSGIRRELERHADMEVAGEAHDGQTALELVAELHPHLILLDISLPDMSGFEVAQQITRLPRPANATHWPPLILVLSAYAEPEYVYGVFAAGAKGYLLKDELPRRIVQGIREVMSGVPALSLRVQQVLLSRRQHEDDMLTKREMEVLQLIARGYTNEEIAEELVIAIGTVKNHVTNIYHKLPGVHTRAEAVAWAWQNGLIR